MSLCCESPAVAAHGGGDDAVGGEFMLFGVRVKVDPMRKSVSMNNLSEYEPVNNINPANNETNELSKAAAEDGAASCYASADDAVPQQSNGSRERKRGVPWTEEEHKLFLIGLQKVGKGDWRGISRNYVKTRSPTQVASHAQKYFLRRSNLNRRRRRSSLFDITTDSVSLMPIEEARTCQETPVQLQPVPPPADSMPIPVNPSISGFSVVPFPVAVSPVSLSTQGRNPIETLSIGLNEQVTNSPAILVPPVPVLSVPTSSKMAVDLNLNHQMLIDPSTSLSLGLSFSSNPDQSSTVHSAFSFQNGDNIISVA